MPDYGLPYMGSKGKLAGKIMQLLPPATHLYDLFCGGCAIAHYAVTHRRFRHVHINDLRREMPQLFQEALNGRYKWEDRWISREDFFQLKDTDPYILNCWSFGCNGREYLYALEREYLYALEREQIRKAMHYLQYFGDVSLFHELGIMTDGTEADLVKNHAKYMNIYFEYLKHTLFPVGFEFEQVGDIAKEIKNTEERLRLYLVNALKASGLTQREVGRRLGTQMEGHYFGASQWNFPTHQHYAKMREFMPLGPEEKVGLDRYWALKSIYSRAMKVLEFRRQAMADKSFIITTPHNQRIERLRRIGQANRLADLSLTVGDYRDVKISADSVIYCDPPYRNTEGYLGTEEFDHKAFYDWCENQEAPVFISEYNMPADRFDMIAEFKHMSQLNAQKNKIVSERVFVPKKQRQRGTRQLSLFD